MNQVPFWDLVDLKNSAALNVIRQDGAPYIHELVILRAAVETFKPVRVLDIGTGRGTTAELFARLGCEVVTVGISEENLVAMDVPSNEFVYMLSQADWIGTTAKLEYLGVQVIQADTLVLDFSDLGGTFDMVFVDGGHSYENVANDSRKGWTVLNDGGWMVWHDYMPESGALTKWPGVLNFIHGFNGSHSLVHVKGTSLVMLEKQAGMAL